MTLFTGSQRVADKLAVDLKGKARAMLSAETLLEGEVGGCRI